LGRGCAPAPRSGAGGAGGGVSWGGSWAPSRWRRGSTRSRLAGEQPQRLDFLHVVPDGEAHQLAQPQMLHRRGTHPAVALASLEPNLHEHLRSWHRVHTDPATTKSPAVPKHALRGIGGINRLTNSPPPRPIPRGSRALRG